MNRVQYKWKHLPMMKPYILGNNTTGREFLNKDLVPRFSEFFKGGDKILCTGKHPYWDYSTFFNNPRKLCEYITVDIQEEVQPDIVDNLGESKLGSESFDGILCIGLFDSIINTTREKIKKELTRLLKPGGRMLLAADVNCPTSFIKGWPEYMRDELYFIYGEGNKVGDKGYYQEGKVQSSFVVLRKR